MSENYEKYMRLALEEAAKAYEYKEAPIGCVIVKDNFIISKAFNQRNTLKSTLAHAELLAISEASKILGDWRLEGCEMYITLEPCPMCAGAIVQARMKKVIIGAPNFKSGSAGSIINILQEERFNHRVEIINGILEDECSTLLKKFFRILRKNKEGVDSNE